MSQNGLEVSKKPLTLQEVKEQIKKNVVFKNNEMPGGQTCGLPISKTHLISEDIDVEIIVNHYRSTLKNRELAFTLFELALDDIVRE